MTDVWQGEILLPDNTSVKGVGFSAHNVTASPAFTATSLRFLSTVDPARIPLYLAAGPRYDVWTTSEASEAWFESILLSQPVSSAAADGNDGTHEWWTLARAQSPVGILVEVQGQADGVLKPKITEVLFYGTIAAEPTVLGLQTPSSPQNASNAPPGSLPELHVHALPLSSDLLYQGAASAGLPPSPTPGSVDQPYAFEAQYLPPLQGSTATTPKSPKRKRDLFEEATLARRKAKSRGGEGVAAAAAAAAHTGDSQRAYTHRKSLSTDTKPSPFPDSRPPSAHGAISRPVSRQLSRSPSVSSDIRPLSRKDTAAETTHGRRSHLSRVDTISSQPEEPTTESRNKEALTKVVLAAMRMHGLQQRKKGKPRVASGAVESRGTGTASERALAEEDAAKDEEYKQIYHQTYRGAALALRDHITSKPLHAQPDRMRDLVEQFLTLFLNDPFAEPPHKEAADHPASTPGLKQGAQGASSHHASPFDLPSGMRRPPIARAQTDGQVYTGSPVSKRKGNERNKLDDV
ncbi:hypothetical protein E8E13_001225 [Curvularia kusanoi]|uniref:Sld7 C-terminal domain-containing protein n=1 Tax=Curvularia kusanoi TaxID=90978 RepID=A0A9P4WBG3_CURKU|nr:hypothetical protein E8E13_001225 [Curvularia kusanoi]